MSESKGDYDAGNTLSQIKCFLFVHQKILLLSSSAFRRV